MRSAFLVSIICLGAAARAAQPSAPSPVSAPLRELPWGLVNVLHSSDTHGWLAGHLQESVILHASETLLTASTPAYSGDWGDYISFAHHLRQRAHDDGNDLLIIDTGDRVDGNGLYDASKPKGNYTREIFAQQDLDLICVGNHE